MASKAGTHILGSLLNWTPKYPVVRAGPKTIIFGFIALGAIALVVGLFVKFGLTQALGAIGIQLSQIPQIAWMAPTFIGCGSLGTSPIVGYLMYRYHKREMEAFAKFVTIDDNGIDVKMDLP